MEYAGSVEGDTNQSGEGGGVEAAVIGLVQTHVAQVADYFQSQQEAG